MKIEKIVEKPFKEVEEYPKFDFIKPVKKQRTILMPLVWLLSLPETFKRKLKIKKINMDSLKKEPYLLINNHNSFYDFKVATRAIFPKKASYVVAIDGFINREQIMREVGCFGKRKFINDSVLVRQIKKSVVDYKQICMLYPEARYSHVGTNSIIPDSIGKLIKLLKVPVVTLITQGNHLAQPVWNLKKRKVRTEAVMTQVITKEETATLSHIEINDKINQVFSYNDYQWQEENKIKINEKFRAEGLENVLYKCPVCESEEHMASKDNELKCTKCNSSWHMNEYGVLKNENNTFTKIPEWYEWQRMKVKEEILNDTYKFSHKINIDSLPNSNGFYRIGQGILTHDKNGFKITGTDIEKNSFEIIQPAINNYSVHVEYNYFKRGNGISFSTIDDTYYMFSKDKSYLVTKVHFAVEEIFKLINQENI